MGSLFSCFSSFAADTQGECLFVTRFIRPQAPPAECSSPEMAARFVSLVPFLEDHFLFEGRSDLWCLSHEVCTFRSQLTRLTAADRLVLGYPGRRQ